MREMGDSRHARKPELCKNSGTYGGSGVFASVPTVYRDGTVAQHTKKLILQRLTWQDGANKCLESLRRTCVFTNTDNHRNKNKKTRQTVPHYSRMFSKRCLSMSKVVQHTLALSNLATIFHRKNRTRA